MPDFLADENITRPVVDGLNKAGLSTIHIEYDLGMAGMQDPEILSEGIKRRLTVLTNNNGHFKKMNRAELKNGSVWCLQSAIPKEQILRAVKIKRVGKFNSKKSREGKLVICNNAGFTVEECKTQKTTTFSFDK